MTSDVSLTSTPGGSSESSLLVASDVYKSFNGVVAVDGMDLSVERGQMAGLIGPNGAGKSTMFDLISGLTTPDRGSIVFDGTEITRKTPWHIAQLGLVRSFQIARELKQMTVMENVMLAGQHQPGEAFWRAVLPGVRSQVIDQEIELRDHAWEILDFFELDHLAGEYAGNLSGGQRKLLELARVLMTEPTMILLDEPFAGVNPTLEEKLLGRLHALQAEGYTILLVEHDMEVIMNHCEPITVMHQGQRLLEGDPQTVQDDERVLEAYLGAEVWAE